MIKKQLYDKIIGIIEQRLSEARVAIEAAKESRDSETKSSVGDKYETGRTLMQQEVEKNRVLLHKTERLKAELEKIDINKKHEWVDFGSLVITNQHTYFISTALGKIDLDGETCFCISLASPVGNLLYKKKEGDILSFQGKEMKILEIL